MILLLIHNDPDPALLRVTSYSDRRPLMVWTMPKDQPRAETEADLVQIRFATMEKVARGE